MTNKRIEFHSHTLLSDGVLVPSELIQNATDKGFHTIALTDHADISTLEYILDRYKTLKDKQYSINVLFGVELTYVAPKDIKDTAKKAKELGADIVVVHGETPVEYVEKGTNKAALEASDYVDILAHPGFLTEEEAILAAKNNVYLEITSRRGHSLTNGHVVKIGKKHNCKFLVNSDTHGPEDLISTQKAMIVGQGAGLTINETLTAVDTNAQELLKKIK
jgi:putative hydrolase